MTAESAIDGPRSESGIWRTATAVAALWGILSLPVIAIAVGGPGAVTKSLKYLVLLLVLFVSLDRQFTFLLLFGSFFFAGGLLAYSLSELAIFWLAFLLACSPAVPRPARSNTMVFPLWVYLATTLPSLAHVSEWVWTLTQYGHLAVFFLATVLIARIAPNVAALQKGLAAFVAVGAVNSIYLLYQTTTTYERVFGFAGVMFVDYSALCVVIASLSAIFSRGSRRALWIGAAVLLFLGLLGTQTRNPMVSLFLSMASATAVLFFQSRHLSLQRATIVKFVAAALVLGALVGGYFASQHAVLSARIASLNISKASASTVGEIGANSLITRILIWDTAINGFKAHPLVGIGAYGFPVSSKKYSTINVELYNKFVKGLSPHLAYLMVLCETGVIGFLGFLFLIGSLVRQAILNVPASKSIEEKRVSVVLVGCSMYMVFSLGMSDAWFYGHGAALLGSVIGLVAAQGCFLGRGALRCANQASY